MQVQALSGSASDTLDVTIEESDESDFATSSRIRTLHTFTQVLGNSTGSLLYQVNNPSDNTINRFIRAKVVIGNTAATFSQKVTVIFLFDERV